MLRNHIKLSLFLLLVFAAAAIAGCSKPAQDTKTPPSAQVGIIDMDKVIKAHPQYSDYQRLQKELNTLLAQAEAQGQQVQTGQPAAAMPALPNGAAEGLDQALAQEFNAKMEAKKAEIKSRLDAEAAKIRTELSASLDAYTKEIDKDYQPRIFSLQLKLKTVQLTKEEMAALQKELEQLQGERSAKIAAKQQQLSASMDARMAPLQKAADQELNAYAQSLEQELKQHASTKKAEIAARSQLTVPAAPNNGGADDLTSKIMQKRQEITALQEAILRDIRDKTAKVAAQRKLEAVLAAYKVNISAVDVTDAVIAEFKK